MEQSVVIGLLCSDWSDAGLDANFSQKKHCTLAPKLKNIGAQ